MGINKLLICILMGTILSGCAQSTAMLGPAITLASSGNVSQAGLTFFLSLLLNNKGIFYSTQESK